MAEIIPNSQKQPTQADVVAMIGKKLAAEKAPPPQPTEPAAEAPPEQPSQPEGEDGYVPSNNAQVEGGDAPPTEAREVAEIPIEQLEAIELEVKEWAKDGGERKLSKRTIKELREGYMRHDDYMRNIQDVARQREEAGQKVRQGIESERAQYLQTLQQLQSAVIQSVAPELGKVDWNKLATDDPFEYVRLQNRAQQVSQVVNGIRAAEQQALAKANEDSLEAKRQRAQKTWSSLESEVPGWSSEVYQSAIKAAADSVGAPPDEVGAWLEPWQIKLLHKGYLYDQLKAGKPTAEKRVVVAPKATTPGSPTASSPRKQVEQARERLRTTGSVRDLAAVLAAKNRR